MTKPTMGSKIVRPNGRNIIMLYLYSTSCQQESWNLDVIPMELRSRGKRSPESWNGSCYPKSIINYIIVQASSTLEPNALNLNKYLE